MAIVTNGRLEYEMSTIDVTYPDIGKVTYTGSTPCIVPNNWTPQREDEAQYLTFIGENNQEFTLNATNKVWDGILEYSTDLKNWTILNDSELMNSQNGKLYLRGYGNTTFCYVNGGSVKGVKFSLSAKAKCVGNIQTLLQYNNPPTYIPSERCFSSLFMECEYLTEAPDLPATKLTYGCYSNMFTYCTNLVKIPKILPAMELADRCYANMFYKCKNLVTPLELPATTLANGCYQNMFICCDKLSMAPKLPATTLAPRCYSGMFYENIALTIAPELPATTLANECYMNMFGGCESLRTAPKLNATTLPDQCYYNMFRQCSNLKANTSGGVEIFTMPTDSSNVGENAVYSMFDSTGGSLKGDPELGVTYYYESQS